MEGATPLINAVQENRLEHINLLITAGADVNARDGRNFTSLHRAAERGYIEAVEILLTNGADPSIVAENNTPLSLAVMRGEKKIADILQKHS